LAWMVTVPAQSFSAPTLAKLMAAFLSMPGVEGTLPSSWLQEQLAHRRVSNPSDLCCLNDHGCDLTYKLPVH